MGQTTCRRRGPDPTPPWGLPLGCVLPCPRSSVGQNQGGIRALMRVLCFPPLPSSANPRLCLPLALLVRGPPLSQLSITLPLLLQPGGWARATQLSGPCPPLALTPQPASAAQVPRWRGLPPPPPPAASSGRAGALSGNRTPPWTPATTRPRPPRPSVDLAPSARPRGSSRSPARPRPCRLRTVSRSPAAFARVALSRGRASPSQQCCGSSSTTSCRVGARRRRCSCKHHHQTGVTEQK